MVDEIYNMDDLEDGEIESDAEQHEEEPAAEPPSVPEPVPSVNRDEQKREPVVEQPKKNENKSDKKKSKEQKKSEREYKSSAEKHRPNYPPGPVEDDFAGNIEKAIRKELKKRDEPPNENGDSGVEDADVRRRHKKRKKTEHIERETTPKKKRRDHSKTEEDVDEDEMMCIRGASPVRRRRGSRDSPPRSDEEDSCGSEDSDREFGHGRDRIRSRGFRGAGGMRDFRGDRMRHKYDRYRMDKHPMQEADGICLFYMQGKCFRDNDCIYSHDARPPRKMELCKFYLMDCCAKKDKCLYLHSDFPCKFYHTGLDCDYKDECKFAHGKPLSDNLKLILLKHIESAPKEILGDFPRINREEAMNMISERQEELKLQYRVKPEKVKKSMHSLDEHPARDSPKRDDHASASNDSSQRSDKSKKSKVRQSRWCDSPPVNSYQVNPATQSILSVQNLNGVLTSQQIADLTTMGIEDLNQLSQLTVIQLNQLGININQINEIQLNTMNIQKLGLIESNAPPASNPFINKMKNKDLDMRVSPVISEMSRSSPSNRDDSFGKDVDMRFHSSRSDKENTDSAYSVDPRKHKNSLDVDQYTKDALKFSSLEKDSSKTDISSKNSDKSAERRDADVKKEVDVDHRFMNYVRDATVAKVKLDDTSANRESDTDIRLASLPIKQQQMFIRIQQKNEERARRPTTDDEDDSLQIDEKWYSSDEEQGEKQPEKAKSPQQDTESPSAKPSLPQVIEPNTVLKNLGDLSKIDISEEVTKLLTSIKSNTTSENTTTSKKDYLKSRDPRNLARLSTESKDSSTESSKKASTKSEFVSIYDCSDTSNAEARRRSDVDLRPTKDLDLRLAPSFGDTDLRQTPGGSDVDLRLGLPLKLLPNYTPAKEIDGSIGSHPPMVYKVALVDIPRPNYADIKNSTLKSQAANDPRLRKIFRLSIDEPSSDSEKSAKVTASAPRADPRKRVLENSEKLAPSKPSSLDLQTVIQTSDWYKDLSSNNKILVNQQLASVMSNLKKYHQDKSSSKKFDLTDTKTNPILCMIFGNLGISLDEKGEFFRTNSQDNIASNMQSMNFAQNSDMFMGGMMDNMMSMNSMGGGNMGPMGNMGNMNNMGPMNSYDPRFSGDPRSAPGILGMPPNMPPNYDNMNYNGMSNYNSDNNFNNSYDNGSYNNGIGNNGNDGYSNENINDYREDNYYREQNDNYKQNKYRGGRGNERWGRGRSRGGGGGGGGGRDHRGYTERSGWKNDRH